MARIMLPSLNMEVTYDADADELNILTSSTALFNLINRLKTKKKKRRRRKQTDTITIWRGNSGVNHMRNLRSMSEEKFHNYYRVTKARFNEIHEFIKNEISKEIPIVPEFITTEEKLLMCLRFLGTANSLKSWGFGYALGYIELREIILNVCNAICEKMGPTYMPKPTAEMWQESEDCYRNILNFPNCCGALYGKHVNILCPLDHDPKQICIYCKDKEIVMLALVNAKSKFLFVDVGMYTEDSDGGVYTKSILGKLLESGELQLPAPNPLTPNSEPLPHVIVADEAFPLKPYLMRPYRSDNSNKIFNHRLSHALCTAENAFAIAKARWRIFAQYMPVNPDMVEKIILATCCLHNFLDLDDLPPDYCPETDDSIESETFSSLKSVNEDFTEDSLTVRNKYNKHFCEEDEVSLELDQEDSLTVRNKYKKYFFEEDEVSLELDQEDSLTVRNKYKKYVCEEDEISLELDQEEITNQE